MSIWLCRMWRETRKFFEKYFAFHCPEQKGRDTFAVLTDETGFVLTLSNLDKVDQVNYPGIFHIGFMQESPESSERNLSADERRWAGGQPTSENFTALWTFYVQAPGNVMVEVGHNYPA